MRITEVQLTNFRCFEAPDPVRFDPDENVHILVGDNGAGKSAILDAIAFGLAPVCRLFSQPVGGKSLQLTDITENPWSEDDLQTILAPLKPFCQIRYIGNVNGRRIEWDTLLPRDKSTRTKALLPRSLKDKQLTEALDRDVFLVAEQTGGVVPVFAYYGTNRAVIDIPQRRRNFGREFSREGALRSALDPVSRFKDAFEWFVNAQAVEGQANCSSLHAVRRAILSMLPEYENPRITAPLHFTLTRRNEDGSQTNLYAEQLSDGYRTMLALVMDFARRLAQANPQMSDPLSSEAILLIDEVDLHLHPDWQQTIVPDLQRTFPNTQLILTTHSPAVLTSVHSRNVQVLRDARLHRAPGGIYGAESKRTLERVMGISSRPPKEKNPRVEKLEKLFEWIANDKLDEAKELASALNQEFAGNEPAVDEAMTMIENRLWEKEVGL